MRTKVLLLAALLVTSWGAQAGNDDTLKVFRVHFNQRLESVKFSGYCKVEVVNDSVEYLESSEQSASSLPKGLTYNLGRNNNGGNLTVDAAAGVGKFRLHLMMDAFVSIKAEDYSQVKVVIPDNVVKLSVLATDYSEVDVEGQARVDTLHVRHVLLSGEDYATVTLTRPCVMEEMRLQAEDYANVEVAYCKGTNLQSIQQDHGRVRTKAQDVVHKTYSTTINGLDGEEDGSMAMSDEGEMTSATKIMRKACAITDDFRVDFLWGFHNWGSAPLNGLMKMDGGYALRTTFSSYQIEAVYYPLVSNHWRLGLGLGYGSDVYKFSDGCVNVAGTATGTMQTFAITNPDDGGEWSTKLVARYVALPLMVRWEPGESDFFIGLAAIPGLNYNGKHTGLKHKVEYANGSYSAKDDVSKVMNPFRLDARLSIGWEDFYAFMQVATLPVNTGMDKAAYPIKFGLALSLGDE